MAIRQNRNSYVLDAMVEGKRIRLTFKTKKEAEQAEAKIKLAVLADDDVVKLVESLRARKRFTKPKPSKHITIKELIELTHRRCWVGLSYEKVALLNSYAIADFLGEDTLVKDITLPQIDLMIDHFKQQGNANATINRKLTALSKLLHFALERSFIHTKPKIEKLKEPKGRMRIVSESEELILLRTLCSIEQNEVADFVTCLVDTGCRVGELRRVTRDDVNDNVLNIWITKNNESRSVPMTKRVKEILCKRAESNHLLFESVTKAKLRSAWNNTKTIMGLNDDIQFVPHCLRHTCASRLVQRGVPLTTVKEWLGHKSIQVTMRYAHLSPKNLLDAVKVLEG